MVTALQILSRDFSSTENFMKKVSGFIAKMMTCVWNVVFWGKAPKTRLQEGVLVFPWKSRAPAEFIDCTYKARGWV
jgi:hypothetical protein